MLPIASLNRNLELKARLPDLAAARAVVCTLAHSGPTLENQLDTFFLVPHGRLKLREIDGQPAVLIWYERPDQNAARLSQYYLVPVPQPATMKAALTAALGVRGVVRKQREIFLWHNVRIHLDEVADLGTFVEFEAVLSPTDDEAAGRERLDYLRQRLGIGAADHIAAAYADLLQL